MTDNERGPLTHVRRAIRRTDDETEVAILEQAHNDIVDYRAGDERERGD